MAKAKDAAEGNTSATEQQLPDGVAGAEAPQGEGAPQGGEIAQGGEAAQGNEAPQGEGAPQGGEIAQGGEAAQGNDAPQGTDGAVEHGKGDDRQILVRTISGKPRRRSGIAFGKEPVTVRVADLSEDELKAICDDDLLLVSLSD